MRKLFTLFSGYSTFCACDLEYACGNIKKKKQVTYRSTGLSHRAAFFSIKNKNKKKKRTGEKCNISLYYQF